MQIEFTVQTWWENDQFIAHARPLDVASTGPTPAAAKEAVNEAVGLFLRTASEHGTLREVLEEAGYQVGPDACQSPQWVGIERGSAVVEG
ncbi:MAG: hypothetical protein KDM81_06530 [Verrucomicrobiae bacterium]|nr:hypothetical protein [Verrucomicrobiae bacterium]